MFIVHWRLSFNAIIFCHLDMGLSIICVCRRYQRMYCVDCISVLGIEERIHKT